MGTFELQRGSFLGGLDTLGGSVGDRGYFFDDNGNPQVTEVFWEIDGDGLNNYAWNISTIEGRSGIPQKRGSNFPNGNRPGTTWMRKPHDEKKRTLAMWARGSDRWGNVEVDQTVTFHDNYRHLKQMFGVTKRLLNVTKRMRFSEGLIVMSAQAECTSELEPVMSGPNMGAFTVDLTFPDPYWYSPSQVATGVLTPSTGVGTGFDIVYPMGFGGVQRYDLFVGVGGDIDTFPVITFTGPAPAPAVENITTGERFRWLSTLSPLEQLVVDSKNQTVTVGGVTRYGEVDRAQNDWISLAPRQTNQLRFTADAYDPSASYTVEHQDTYL